MKKFMFIVGVFLLTLALVGGTMYTPNANEIHDTTTNNTYNEDVTVYIPLEFFFQVGSLESFTSVFRGMGGVVAELDVDVNAFWRNIRNNPESVYLEVTFSQADLAEMVYDMGELVRIFTEAIAESFGAITEFRKEVDDTATRIIFTADIYDLLDNYQGHLISLIDFAFPTIGQFEYLRRIFSQYDMTALDRISFYFEDVETREIFELYCVLLSTHLSLRHPRTESEVEESNEVNEVSEAIVMPAPLSGYVYELLSVHDSEGNVIHYGMLREDVERILGTDATRDFMNLYGYGYGISIVYRDDRVVLIQIDEPGWQTRNGAEVGMRASGVPRLYDFNTISPWRNTNTHAIAFASQEETHITSLDEGNWSNWEFMIDFHYFNTNRIQQILIGDRTALLWFR